MSKYIWFGNDASNECSLFDNGLLMRRRSKNEYEVYTGGCAEDGKHLFVHGYFNFDSWVQILDDPNEEETWDFVGSLTSMSGKEYRKYILEDLGGDSGASSLLFDLLMCYSDEDVLIHPRGCDLPVYTENEVRIKLNKALAA